MEIAVAGTTYEGRQEVLRRLRSDQQQGSRLTGQLVREPDNRFDPNAVAVEIERQQVGYVPKAVAARLARRLDAGEPINVLAVRIVSGGDRLNPGYGVRIDLDIQTLEAV